MANDVFNRRARKGYDLVDLPVGRKANLRDYLLNTTSIIALVIPAALVHQALDIGATRLAASIGMGATVGMALAFNSICKIIDAQPALHDLVRHGEGSPLRAHQKESAQDALYKSMLRTLQPSALGLSAVLGGTIVLVQATKTPEVMGYMPYIHAATSATTFAGLTYMGKMLAFGGKLGMTKPNTLRYRA